MSTPETNHGSVPRAIAIGLLLAAVLISAPRAVIDRDALGDPKAPESGWRILRRRPVAARLLVVVFFFNLFYMPIEVALPLYVRGTLDADASALGLMWGALGVGAFIGAALAVLKPTPAPMFRMSIQR